MQNNNENIPIINKEIGYIDSNYSYSNFNQTFFKGTSESDFLDGSDYGDIIEGYEGNDVIFGNRGNDFIDGGEGHDIIYGGKGNDLIFGGYGNDTIYGGNNSDVIFGEEGNDYLEGNDGDDYIFGGAGDDHIQGGNGDDVIFSEEGNNVIDGGEGDDQIFLGGGEIDFVTGGKGHDEFLIQTTFFNFDKSFSKITITDFDLEDDIINLDSFYFYNNIESLDISSHNKFFGFYKETHINLFENGVHYQIILENIDINDLNESSFIFNQNYDYIG